MNNRTLSLMMGAAGAGGAAAGAYIEDIFSTYLFTGTGAALTITNGIDLAGKGGLIWNKARSIQQDNYLVDTARGNGSIIYSNQTHQALLF